MAFEYPTSTTESPEQKLNWAIRDLEKFIQDGEEINKAYEAGGGESGEAEIGFAKRQMPLMENLAVALENSSPSEQEKTRIIELLIKSKSMMGDRDALAKLEELESKLGK